MATGFLERETVQDPNAPDRGNAPNAQLSIPGIQGGVAAQPEDTSGITAAIEAFGAVGAGITRRRQNADFIEGQMASMSGQTQAEVAAEGNRTTMAGFVALEVGNAVSEWAAAEQQAAATQHYGTSPEEYNRALSESAAGLIAQMGGDDFAEAQLTQALAPAMQRLAAAQSGQHAAWVQGETANAYTTSLILSGQTAASNYPGAETGPNGPVVGATSPGGDYRAFAASISPQLINSESGGDPNAVNPDPRSSATGLGQFVSGTWLATLRRYRPDLAEGRSDEELLAMRTNGPLSRAMSIEYTAEVARGLSASGHTVTAGTTYLAYFAGLGGARRVLSGDPNATVDTTLTPIQIAANRSVMYRDGRMITNRELAAWAANRMGGPAPAGQDPAAPTQANVLANPGLPPDVHRTAVVNAMVTSLGAGDGSLWQSAGGLEGLAGLNLPAAQLGQVMAAHRRFEEARQNEYNMSYERERHNLLERAATGDFTEEEMFAQLDGLHNRFGRSDAEQRRLHGQMQEAIDGEAAGVWATPERQLDLMEVRNSVLDGDLTAEEAVGEITAIGEMYGSDAETTQSAVGVVIEAYERVLADERREIARVTEAGIEERQVRDRAAALLSMNVLGTGTAEEQAAGIAQVEETILADLQAADVDPEEIPSRMSALMAQVLVTNDLVDPRRASVMRAAFQNPVGADGRATPRSVEALAYYLDLQDGAGAPPEYMARMFSGNERTLELMMTAAEHAVGDADLDTAIIQAYAQINNPVTAARIAQTQQRLDSGAIQTAVVENIITNSGLANTAWNNTMNFFNNNWSQERLDAEGQARIMDDSGLHLVIEQEVRSAVGLMPNASEETIVQVVSGQMAERGAVIGSSFVMAPRDTDVRTVMGLIDTAPAAPNEAMVRYVMENGEELFGPAVWADIAPNLMDRAATGEGMVSEALTAATSFLGGNTVGEARRDAGWGRPEFSVELVGDNFVIRPASERYTFDDDLIFDDYASLPEAAVAVIPATEVGSFYNSYQTRPTAVGAGVGMMIEFFSQGGGPRPM